MEHFKRLVYSFEGERYLGTSTKLWVDDRRRFWHVSSLKNKGLKGAILIDVPESLYKEFKVVGIAYCSSDDYYDTNLEVHFIGNIGGNND